MNSDMLWERVRMAWAMLSDNRKHDARPGRPPRPDPAPAGDEPFLQEEGFVEEALPQLDAVYAFALRLVKGNVDAAEDLVQDTFLRAHRSWHTYERDTNVKSWLFTICRNTYLGEKELMREQREIPAADFDARAESLSTATVFADPPENPEHEFFDTLLDDEVVRAIDGLPDEFREVVVLSDLGDLKYREVSEVLDLPVGTVKSRLFRGRKLLQEQLRDFALRSGYIEEAEGAIHGGDDR